MTRFAYICRNGRCVLRADGHAAYCPGSDIVCAGASALMCALAGALDQLAYQKICHHDEHRGHQLQPTEEPQIQPEHIGKVALQDAAENTA